MTDRGGRGLPARRRAVLATLAGVAAAVTPASVALVAGGAGGPSATERLRLMVPAAAGGGYDLTARTLAITLRDADLAEDVAVFNLTGGAGTVALTRLLHESGNDRLLLQMGLGLVGSAHAAGSRAQIADATPLARLLDEPEAVVVTAASPYTTAAGLVRDWRDGALTAGVGSHPGGPDHLALMLTAEAAGLDPTAVRFARYDGGGGLLAALVSRQVDFVMTGISEFRHAIAAGELRVLAVTGPAPVTGVDAPTLRQAGYDLVVLNWRGLLAPPGLSQRQRTDLTALLDRMRASEQWRRALTDNGWADSYLTGLRFARFLDAEDQRVGALLDRLASAA